MSACTRAGSDEPVVDAARTAQEIVDQGAATTDLPELVALPDDEWRALLETDLGEAELIRGGA